MSNLSIESIRKFINAVDELEIPQSFMQGRAVESESDLEIIVNDYKKTKQVIINKEKEQADADIKAWAAGKM